MEGCAAAAAAVVAAACASWQRVALAHEALLPCSAAKRSSSRVWLAFSAVALTGCFVRCAQQVLRCNYAQPQKIKGGDAGWSNQPVWADADDYQERLQQQEAGMVAE
jgi:hypothetical protein